MFTNINNYNVQELYSLYTSGEYEGFFRHMEDFLNLEEFAQVVSGYKWLSFEGGFISLDVRPKPKLCYVSILVIKEEQLKGLGLKAMIAVSEYLFNNGIERLIVKVIEDDNHTVRMCEKGGFDMEGIYVNSCKTHGLYHNELRFGISKETYFKKYGGSNG